MKKKIEHEINKLKHRANTMLKKKRYDEALVLISCAASILYEYNQTYRDDDLENDLLKMNEVYRIENDTVIKKTQNKNVVFYDAFGLDLRGLAYIYISALCDLNFHIIYLTNKNRIGDIPRIRELLEANDSEIIAIPWNTHNMKRAKFIYETVKMKTPVCAFLYTTPCDSSGILAFNHLEGAVLRFQINLTDHAFWLGLHAFDYCLEFRDYGASISYFYRGISKSKLVLQPYHPIIDNKEEFKGYPFEKKAEDFVLFSGGALYKTKSRDNLYYIILNEILSQYPRVKFWYAGFGNWDNIRELKSMYKGRVFFTAERSDLIEIMRHCDAYLSTYPLTGGLMMQYAAVSGIAPLTLYKGEENRGLLKKECEDKVTFKNKEDLLTAFGHIYNDPEYCSILSRELKESIITPNEFKMNIQRIIEDRNSQYEAKIERVRVDHFRKNYKLEYSVRKLRGKVAMRSNILLLRCMPLYYVFCMGNRVCGMVLEYLKSTLGYRRDR